jgi:hypothetical protein
MASNPKPAYMQKSDLVEAAIEYASEPSIGGDGYKLRLTLKGGQQLTGNLLAQGVNWVLLSCLLRNNEGFLVDGHSAIETFVSTADVVICEVLW